MERSTHPSLGDLVPVGPPLGLRLQFPLAACPQCGRPGITVLRDGRPGHRCPHGHEWHDAASRSLRGGTGS